MSFPIPGPSRIGATSNLPVRAAPDAPRYP
ncbi:hypothetical protein GGP57_002284 [Salinibacter ruber]|uniref:Uncharacterized protein n=1 Tax=Salinibacter ruber TaxID=146919 RepID=A0A9X2V6E4_9BACT|nr:hypothetical protein [Salinibacter ruber]MCS4121685.1 hypothetical protein [Salinibacter ruber]